MKEQYFFSDSTEDKKAKRYKVINVKAAGNRVAILTVADPGGSLPAPLKLIENPLCTKGRFLPGYIVGYPSKDARFPPELRTKIFGTLYNVQRIMPSLYECDVDKSIIHHDSTTLGGCGGAPFIDLSTGNVAGLHWGGSYDDNKKHGFATTSDQILKLLNTIQ